MNSFTVKTQLYKVAIAIVLGISLAIIYTGNISAAPSTNEVKSAVGKDVEEAKRAHIQEAYGKLPLSFIQNDGQVEKKVKFYEKGNGRATFFTKDGIYLSLTNGQGSSGQGSSKSPSSQSEVIKLLPLGANKHPKIVAEGIQKGKVNYFIGNDPKKWKTNISTYQAVVYQEIYPGIDLKFYGNNRQMEYDIIVKPGADLSKVKFAYEGIEGLRVTDDGNLEIGLKEGAILQKKPIVYQEIDGKQMELDGKFKILEQKNTIGHGEDNTKSVTFAYAIEVAQYDKNHPLIIDPVLVYSTYLGGSNTDYGFGIAVDAADNAYVTGYTFSTNFPGTAGSLIQASLSGVSDVFVTKLDASGSALVYSTYLGGSNGDYSFGIAVDAADNAYVVGYTSSINFPTTIGSLQTVYGGGTYDAFMTKLNAAGSSLIYSTYLGGSNDDSVYRIALDPAGNAYVTGGTGSSNFPVTPGSFQTVYKGGTYDAFVTKLNASGSALVYSTYLGGSGFDDGRGIALDASDNAYVTGYTLSSNFPTTPGSFQTANAGGYDAFVTKLNAAGSNLIYSTYLGGSNDDYDANGIAIDAMGNAYVMGYTRSSNFPTTPGAFQTANAGDADTFVTKLNASGSALVYSTYLGGNGFEVSYGIALDASDNAYVTGYTSSTNFPTCPSSLPKCVSTGTPFQAVFGGGAWDAFVTTLNASGSALVDSTYLGGSNEDRGFGIAVDASGNVYVTGYTSSTDFPTHSFQAANAGGFDAFVTKIGEPSSKENCNDQNKGQGKDKGKGHDKGKCKGHDRDKD